MRTFYGLAVLALMVSLIGRAADEQNTKKLVVHEWGTFTGISGSDGSKLHFYPDNRDLPRFVVTNSVQQKGALYSTVSLETPVTYFYAREAMTVKVKAEFPQGAFTEWYPHATFAYRDEVDTIEWSNVEVLPGQKVELPGAGEKGRYFRAREAGANLLRVKNDKETQHEGFLFYRGAGDAKLPILVVASGAGYEVKNLGGETIADYFAVNVKEKKLQFLHGTELKPGATGSFDFHKITGEGAALDEAVVKALIAQGLYEKEARAMVATWRDAWFDEDGTRVLYILAKEATEKLLPLQIKPKPDELVRVMVGRQDFFSREQESEFKLLLAELKNGSEGAREKAAKAFAKLGRFGTSAQERAEQLSESR